MKIPLSQHFVLGWVALGILASASPAWSYPEFREYIVRHSGRSVNCAMCHVNADGPQGTGPGQLGKLTAPEQERLARARLALQPGQPVDSPILNAFGNHIVHSLGKTKVVELRLAPDQLAELLPKESDLDGDGIPDVQEYLDGTHPLNRHDGNPWLLFKTNLVRYWSEIVLTVVATLAGLYGLNHLLQGFARATRLSSEDHPPKN
jgi:hypothetical protein